MNFSNSPAKDRGLDMFEEELELEKKSSSWGPLLLVLVFVGCIVGGIGYYIVSMKGLTQAEATTIVERQLKIKTPALTFQAGKVDKTEAEDPQYKVLVKAGLLSMPEADKKAKNAKNVTTATVEVTDSGDKVFASINGLTKKKNTDDTTTYAMPVATRKLIKIDSITMNRPGDATVVYEWQWVPNQIGDLLDLNNEELQSYSTWDRQKLIDKYGADFYHSATKQDTLNLTKGDKGWELKSAL